MEAFVMTPTNGVEVKRYSLIASKFDHWAKHGRFVAEVRQEWTVVPIATDADVG